MNHPSTLDPDQLLAHSAWMRRLAERLVNGGEEADDLVQTAWAAALKNPPRPGVPLRAWLAGILGRAALHGRRGRGRSADREQAVAQAEAVRSTEDLVACADEQRFLLERVLALPEAYRAVLLLRFYEDLPPRAIAKRLTMPVNTVRTRTQRGLAQLRDELDQRHDGDRRRWGLALLPLAVKAEGGRAFLGLSTLAASVLLAVTLVAGAGLFLWRSSPKPTGPDLAQLTTPQEASERLFGVRDSMPSDSPRAPSAPRRVVPTATAALMLGNVVDPAGRPIAGAVVGTSAPPRADGTPFTGVWYGRSALTDADGAFAFERVEDRTREVILATHPDYIQLTGRVTLELNEPATITLTPLAETELEVRVTDVHSKADVAHFQVYVSHPRPVDERVLDGRYTIANAVTHDGQWRHVVRCAEGAPLVVSLMWIHGSDPLAPRHVQMVEPVIGGRTVVDFEVDLGVGARLLGAELVRGRVVDAATGVPIPGVVFVAGPTVRVGPHNLPVRSMAQSSLSGAFTLALAPGTNAAELESRHPQYLSRHVAVGDDPELVIELTRRGSLEVLLRGLDGAPLANAQLLLLGMRRLDHATRSEVEERLSARAATDEAGCFVFEDLLEGSYAVCVCDKPGGADEDALLRRTVKVGAGEAARVTLELAPPDRPRVRGTVQGPESVEAAMIPVFLPYAAEGAWIQARLADGGYDAGAVARGRYLVALVPADDSVRGPVALLPGIDVEGFSEAHLHFRTPATELRGRVVLDNAREGRSTEALSVIALPRVPQGFASEMLASQKLREALRQPVSSDGTFTLRYVADGPHQLLLLAGDEPLAEREVVVAGSAVLLDWPLDQR